MPPTNNKTLSNKEIDDLVKAPLTNDKITHDVWPGCESSIDPSRVDRIAAALKTKIETLGGNYDNPKAAVKKIFADADADGSGNLDETEFIKLMVVKLNFVGYENDVKGLFRRFDIDRSGRLDMDEFTSMLYNEPGTRGTTAIGRVREVLAKRAGGVTSLKSMALQFKIMDSDKSGSVDRYELDIGLQKFLRAYGVELSKFEVDELFQMFDADKSGSVSYDEFIKGIRGGMNEARRALVKLAFETLDSDRKGEVTIQDLAKKYDVSGNPLVKAGKMTPQEVLKSFIRNWQLQHKAHKDSITLQDFYEYYDWVSASIDRDDYFELMIRNAWHIMGGSGWAANTSNLRVLVTHEDGHQSVEGINNDLGLRKDDIEGIKARLRSQGIKAKAISLKDGGEY